MAPRLRRAQNALRAVRVRTKPEPRLLGPELGPERLPPARGCSRLRLGARGGPRRGPRARAEPHFGGPRPRSRRRAPRSGPSPSGRGPAARPGRGGRAAAVEAALRPLRRLRAVPPQPRPAEHLARLARVVGANIRLVAPRACARRRPRPRPRDDAWLRTAGRTTGCRGRTARAPTRDARLIVSRCSRCPRAGPGDTRAFIGGGRVPRSFISMPPSNRAASAPLNTCAGANVDTLGFLTTKLELTGSSGGCAVHHCSRFMHSVAALA